MKILIKHIAKHYELKAGTSSYDRSENISNKEGRYDEPD